MRLRFLLALLAAGLTAQAQTMTVARLVEWLRNPATANESDAALARFLSRVKLGDRLAQKISAPRSHKVVSGDTLASIARKQGVSLAALEAANPGVSPKKLKAGQVLNLP